MRLWHEALIPHLPQRQLCGLHRECCALRGNGWNKKHATVNYVFKHPYTWLVEYHFTVINEMNKRGYNVDPLWLDETYRGKNCKPWDRISGLADYRQKYVYPEHNDAYLKECLENLKEKGIHIEIKEQL